MYIRRVLIVASSEFKYIKLLLLTNALNGEYMGLELKVTFINGYKN